MKKAGEKQERDFTQALMEWNKTNRRQMPWKGEKDPYKIWLSEIILQQTRVEQGRPYYDQFIRAYPHVSKLAAASEKEVFRLWQGLGYYTRCRNMLAAAKRIHTDHAGCFPSRYEEILQLPGVGEYTAAAIASFAFQLPYAVVDGNVQRLLARYFGLKEAVNSSAGKKSFSALANRVLYKKEPGAFNQAIMDFGAMVCTPRQPSCTSCPLAGNCYAFQHHVVQKLPVKIPKAPLRDRFFYYLVVTCQNTFYIRQRSEKDIWNSLYEFPLYESKSMPKKMNPAVMPFAKEFLKKNTCISLKQSKIYRQQLSHQRITAVFLRVTLKKPLQKNPGYLIVSQTDINEFAFPKIIVRYLQDENLVSL